MKFNHFFIASISFLVFCLCGSIFIGCNKENSIVGNSIDNIVQDRNGNEPSIDHGMLQFSGYKAGMDYIKSLQVQEENLELVKAAYIQLGVDVSGEFLPNLTDHPICLLNEKSLGFVSLRRTEEAIINSALNSGQEVFSLIQEPYLKSILNTEGCVVFGNRIFRYFENGGIAIVFNKDWETYKSKVHGKSLDQIQQSFNVIVTSIDSDSWSNYFQVDANSNVISEKTINIPHFEFLAAVSGKQKVENYSLIESSNISNTFTWLYNDGTTSIGVNPFKELHDGEPLRVKINNGIDPENEITVLKPLVPCPDNFTVTKLANNQFRFELPGFVPNAANIKMRWSFSDGFVSAWNVNPILRTFNANATVTCEFWHVESNNPVCFRTKPIVIKCGDAKQIDKTISSSDAGGSGKSLRIDASLWVKNNEVGCKSKNFGKNIFGWWVPLNLVLNSNGVCVDINGFYWHEQTTNGVKECKSKFVTQEKCLLPGQSNGSILLAIPDLGINAADPTKLSSGHKLRILPGTWFGFGTGGIPRLALN